jgi:integrase
MPTGLVRSGSKLADELGWPVARFHDCCHTFASILLHGGVHVPAAAEYLGDTPAVLLSTYALSVPADHDRARSAVEAAFV